MVVMDRYSLRSDPTDWQIMRFNNAVQCLSCICDVLAIFDRSFKQIAKILDLIADLVYLSVSGCMVAQVTHELNIREGVPSSSQQYEPISSEKMDRVDEVYQGVPVTFANDPYARLSPPPPPHHHHQGGAAGAAHPYVYVVPPTAGSSAAASTTSQQPTDGQYQTFKH